MHQHSKIHCTRDTGRRGTAVISCRCATAQISGPNGEAAIYCMLPEACSFLPSFLPKCDALGTRVDFEVAVWGTKGGLHARSENQSNIQVRLDSASDISSTITGEIHEPHLRVVYPHTGPKPRQPNLATIHTSFEWASPSQPRPKTRNLPTMGWASHR